MDDGQVIIQACGVRVARLVDIQPGSMTRVTVAGQQMLLANADGTVLAVVDECSHDGARLSEGDLEGETVVCPWHFSRFCLRTGHVLESPARDDIKAWKVDIVDGQVYVS